MVQADVDRVVAAAGSRIDILANVAGIMPEIRTTLDNLCRFHVAGDLRAGRVVGGAGRFGPDRGTMRQPRG